MKWIDNVGQEFKRLWVVRLLLVSTALSAIAGCLFIFQEWLSPLWYVGLNMGLNLLAIVFRLMQQKHKVEEYDRGIPTIIY